MKNIFFFFCFLIISINLFAQCEGDLFFNNCKQNITNFTFLKSYSVEVKKSKKGEERNSRFSYILSKGSEYILTGCNDDNKSCKMIISLMDFNKRIITSTYLQKSNKYFPAISYKCNATGMYYITFTTSQPDGECCGMSILAFKKN